jgi:hypothetical protein
VALEVSEETREKTTRCWQGFACLLGAEGGPCTVQSCVRGVLFVDKQTAAYCPYDVSFGYSHICSCPTRQEIHDRYGV